MKVFTQRNFAAEFLLQTYTFRGKMVNLRLRAAFGGLEATYAVNLKLIGKLVVDFLLVIIKATPTIVGEAFIFYL